MNTDFIGTQISNIRHTKKNYRLCQKKWQTFGQDWQTLIDLAEFDNLFPDILAKTAFFSENAFVAVQKCLKRADHRGPPPRPAEALEGGVGLRRNLARERSLGRILATCGPFFFGQTLPIFLKVTESYELPLVTKLRRKSATARTCSMALVSAACASKNFSRSSIRALGANFLRRFR